MYRQRRNGALFHHCHVVTSVRAGGAISAENCLRRMDDWMAIADSYLLEERTADARLQALRRLQLDRLYQRDADDLDTLVRAIGLKAA
jgi:hypothetical protein